jgi:hypothetical protein
MELATNLRLAIAGSAGSVKPVQKQMRLAFFFQDIEGKWTDAKKNDVVANLSARWKSEGRTGEPVIRYAEPKAQPNKTGAVIFQYEAYAEAAETAMQGGVNVTT